MANNSKILEDVVGEKNVNATSETSPTGVLKAACSKAPTIFPLPNQPKLPPLFLLLQSENCSANFL